MEEYYCISERNGNLILNWRNVPSITCSAEAFQKRLDELRKHKENEEERSPSSDAVWGGSRRIERYIGKFYVKWNDYSSRIFDFTHKNPIRYVYNKNNNTRDQEDELEEDTGYKCWIALSKLYKRKRGTKTASIRAAFSSTDHKQEYKDIKHCVPKQIQYASQAFSNHIVDHCYKADVSSAFPSNIVGNKLPTLNGCKRVEGFVAPTDEYPFAFYLKSHHISIKDEFSTWEDADMMDLFNYKETAEFYDRVDQDEITILCKRAKKKDEQALWNSFQELYNKRKEDPLMKKTSVVSIGYFHINRDPFCSPLAAVTIARTNHRIYTMCREINRNNIILLVATDSIAWKGREYSRAVREKFLGSFTYECFDSSMLIRGCKNYQYINLDGKCVSKASGIKREISSTWKFGEIPPTADRRKKVMINGFDGGVIII